MRLHRTRPAAGLAVVLAACGGGGEGVAPPPPPQVASVVITAPASAPSFATLGRTAQFTAQARDAAGAAVGGVTLTWASTNAGVASVSAAGLVTAVANGTTTVTAAGGAKTSLGVTVTVFQVVAGVAVTPGAVSMGAKGSTRQLAVAVQDSSTAAVTRAVTTIWSVGDAAIATVNGTGLVTAVANGTTTVIATAEGRADTSDVTVAIVVNAVTVTGSLLPDTLHTTGSTRQFSATATDSNNNTVAGASFTWLSSAPTVASVDGTGLVTAVGDGSTAIQATAGGKSGSRTMVVRRYAATFTVSPAAPQSIATAGGTLTFSGTAQDSVGTNLPISWLSRTSAVATVAPAAGTSTTATAVGNGSTYVVMSGGTRLDSTHLTVTNQPSAPTSAAVQVGDNFFRSVANNTQNAAIDTVAVGGTVTWTWGGSNPHSVRSTGTPSFTSSTTKSSGTYAFMYGSAGTYQYDCAVHGAAMSGRVIVR